MHFFFWELKRSWCCWYNFWAELFEVQVPQACSLLVLAIGDPPSHHDLDFGGPCFVFLVLIAARNPPSHGHHVDCCLPSPLSLLQLLVTFPIVLILVVLILHFLCLQLLTILLVAIFMLIVFVLLFSLHYSLPTLRIPTFHSSWSWSWWSSSCISCVCGCSQPS